MAEFWPKELIRVDDDDPTGRLDATHACRGRGCEMCAEERAMQRWLADQWRNRHAARPERERAADGERRAG